MKFVCSLLFSAFLLFKATEVLGGTAIDGDDYAKIPNNDNTLPQKHGEYVLQHSILPLLQSIVEDPAGADELKRQLVNDIESSECALHVEYITTQLIAWVLSGGTSPPDLFVVHMIDSWGKFPSGILNGHIFTPGDFDECVKARSNLNETGGLDIRGSYCSVYVIPTGDGNQTDTGAWPTIDHDFGKPVSLLDLLKVLAQPSSVPLLPGLGTCFPRSCTIPDTEQLLQNILEVIQAELNLSFVFLPCVQDEKPPLDTATITTIVILGIIVGACVVATLVEVLFFKQDTNRTVLAKPLRALMCFSLNENIKSWLNTKSGNENIGCLHGLRFGSTVWIILVHSWLMFISKCPWNGVDAKLMYKQSWGMMLVLNGTVAVDTFFLMGGALVAYNMLKELEKARKINVPLLYLHRYLRITPAYAILIGIFATILPYVGNGPQWALVDVESQRCRENWWYNLLYVSTIVYPGGSGTCHDTAWYLSNDMIYFLVAPIFVYTLWRWKVVGTSLLILWIAQSTIHTGILVAQNDYAPTLNYFLPADDLAKVVYGRPWTRAAPYAVGILLGYVLHLRRIRASPIRSLPVWAVTLGWTASIVTCLAIVFGPYDIMNADHPENIFGTTATIMYASLHRLAWSIATAWIIFACVHGYGGWVNTFLSWGPFMPLGKLTFCTYILSTMLMKISAAVNYHPVHYSLYNALNNFFSQLFLCLTAGFLLMITTEAPFLQLEKLLFENITKQKPKEAKTLN